MPTAVDLGALGSQQLCRLLIKDGRVDLKHRIASVVATPVDVRVRKALAMDFCGSLMIACSA